LAKYKEQDVKALLSFALMWSQDRQEYLDKAIKTITQQFGQILEETETFNLPYSSYYEKEMGSNLVKKFIVVDKFIQKDKLVEVKHFSEKVEQDLSEGGNRTVNIDPLYIDNDQIVVATSKYRGNRIYLRDGVFAELELWYHHKSFQPFLWTYLDYKEKIPFFNQVREIVLRKKGQ